MFVWVAGPPTVSKTGSGGKKLSVIVKFSTDSVILSLLVSFGLSRPADMGGRGSILQPDQKP